MHAQVHQNTKMQKQGVQEFHLRTYVGVENHTHDAQRCLHVRTCVCEYACFDTPLPVHEHMPCIGAQCTWLLPQQSR